MATYRSMGTIYIYTIQTRDKDEFHKIVNYLGMNSLKCHVHTPATEFFAVDVYYSLGGKNPITLLKKEGLLTDKPGVERP